VHFCHTHRVDGIKKCQQRGKIMLLSMGGAASNGQFATEAQARDYADLLWNMFLGGRNPSIPRPFGDTVFDGLDLNIEGGSPLGYGTFVNRMRVLYDTDNTKTYYIGGAPQCPYPDAYLGPTGFYDGYALGTAWFDFIFVQFYNNFCGIQNYDNGFFNFETWNNWAKNAKTQVFLGVPGAVYSGGGYQPTPRVHRILQDSIDKYGPANGGWFGGLMMWDVGTGETNTDGASKSFAVDLSSFLKGASPNGACSAQTTTSSSSSTTRTSTSSSTSSSSTSTRTSTSTSSSPTPTSSSTSSTRTSTSSSSTSSSTTSSTSSSPSPSPPPPPPPPPPQPQPAGCEFSGPTSSGPGGLWSNLPGLSDIPFMTPTIHLGPALRLNPDTLSSDIDTIMNWPSYDNDALWSPDFSSDSAYVCSFGTPLRVYERNPTQLFIGYPNVGSSVRISQTDINIRLPDKWFGMFLAYAMDEYGLNPHMLLGLAAKESFAPAVAPNTDDSRPFLADDVSKGYDLYGKHFGFGTDGNGDGPFQVEKFSMTAAVSMFPGRFNATANQAQPSFDLDVTIASSPNLDRLHSYWTRNMYRSVVLTSLDFHWRYNALILVPGIGMRVPWDRRTDEESKNALEFAAAMYAYNR
jgi:hypothetical protein